MCIYLPDGFILFPKIGGGCWKHCNFYKWLFSCTCQWNGCVHCFFIFLWFFWFVWLLLLFCFCFLFLVLNIEWFKKKVIFGQWLFQLDTTTFIQPSKEVRFHCFVQSTCLKNRETSSHQWRKHFIIPTDLYSEHRILHKDQISSTSCVKHIKLKCKGHWSLHLIVLTWWCYIPHP